GGVIMKLGRDFRESVMARYKDDPEFAKLMFNEDVDVFLEGDHVTAKAIVRDLINATMGFERLAVLTDKPSKSLHRMLSSAGNPRMDSLSAVFAAVNHQLKSDENVAVHG